MTSCSTLSLNCFPLHRFISFLLFCCIIPFCLYHFIDRIFSLKRKRKNSVSKKFASLVQSILSMTLLWFLGNYEQTFDQTTALFTSIGLILFTTIAEVSKDTHKHTLATMHKWNSQMNSLVYTVVAVLSFVVVHHLHLASEIGEDFRNIYILVALIPIFLSYISLQIARNGGETFHLHHVHLFYAIAFFTRFPDYMSRVAAGLAIGASLHGAAAYGYDSSFETFLA